MPKDGDKLHGLPDNIDARKPPKNFKDAMSRVDAKEWREAYDKEYKGMMDRGAVRAVNPPPEPRFLGRPQERSTRASMEPSINGRSASGVQSQRHLLLSQIIGSVSLIN
jgi:hypothetical protein